MIKYIDNVEIHIFSTIHTNIRSCYSVVLTYLCWQKTTKFFCNLIYSDKILPFSCMGIVQGHAEFRVVYIFVLSINTQSQIQLLKSLLKVRKGPFFFCNLKCNAWDDNKFFTSALFSNFAFVTQKILADVECSRAVRNGSDVHMWPRFAYPYHSNTKIRAFYAFFWVILRRLNFICRRFGTFCPFYLHRQVDAEWPGLRNFANLVILHLPVYEDGTDSVFRNVGI